MTRRVLARLAALLTLAGCDPPPAEPPVRLPPGLPEGATDPRRRATAQAAAVLLDAPPGRPAETAFALGLCEYLATAFQDGRDPVGAQLTRSLREARKAWRATLGIAAEMPPQAVADALFGAAASGRRGAADAAAATLTPVAADGGAPWPALAGFVPPASLGQALRRLRDRLAPQPQPS